MQDGVRFISTGTYLQLKRLPIRDRLPDRGACARNPGEHNMKKTALSVLALLVLAGSTIGAATAHERHHVRTTYRAAPAASEPYRNPYAYGYRDSYAWTSPYPDYSYLQSHLEGGAISAPAGH